MCVPFIRRTLTNTGVQLCAFCIYWNKKSLATHHRYAYLLQNTIRWNNHKRNKIFWGKWQITIFFNISIKSCMRRLFHLYGAQCLSKMFEKDKMSIFWPSSKCIGDGSWRFWWILAYQRQFPDVQQSEFAGRNLPRLNVILIKRSSSGVIFFCLSDSSGLQPTLFARNDWLFGKQLLYEYKNDEQHHLCWYKLPSCQLFRYVRLW